jgi:hypothetical protein
MGYTNALAGDQGPPPAYAPDSQVLARPMQISNCLWRTTRQGREKKTRGNWVRVQPDRRGGSQRRGKEDWRADAAFFRLDPQAVPKPAGCLIAVGRSRGRLSLVPFLPGIF